MRAVLFHNFAEPLEVASVPDPSPPPDGVVIAVAATGICRSDWHGWQGHDPDIVDLPHIPGHELAGEVVAVGSDVKQWLGGERVTTPFVCGCGQCPPCNRGDNQVCDHQTQPGFTHWGSFAEFVVIRHADVNLVAVPEEVDDLTAASLGCRFATSFRAVVDQGRVAPGEWVAVHGCGGVGLSAVMIAKAYGARVIAIDVDDATLTKATELGAEHTINARKTEVPKVVAELTSGGADLSLDALGAKVTAANSMRSLRKNGRHIQVGLLAGKDFQPSLPMELVISRELEFIGSHGLAAHQYPRMLAAIASGQLDPSRLISREVGLEDIPRELMALGDTSAAGMVVVKVEGRR
jgi:alcohol dehydrogenase